jgi:hypothetical protein
VGDVNNLWTASLIGITLGGLPVIAMAQAQLTGKTGYLSEWQFNVALSGGSPSDQFSVPVTWKHVGVCSANGPVEKKGDIDIQIRRMGPWARLKANVSFEQLRCTYSGAYSETVTGFMTCSDKTSLPLTLLFK